MHQSSVYYPPHCIAHTIAILLHGLTLLLLLLLLLLPLLLLLLLGLTLSLYKILVYSKAFLH